MTRRTLFPLAFLPLFAVGGCVSLDTEGSVVAAALPEINDWRLASGKMPTKAEFAALSATCEAKGGAVDSCFADLGLKHAR